MGYAGSTIPSTGTHGPALLYPGLDLPAENDDEFYLVFTSIPAGLASFGAGEDSSITAAATPGTYVGTYEAFKNGVSYGTSTWTLNFGNGLTGTITLDALVPSGDFQGYVPLPPLTNEQMHQLFEWVERLARIHGLVDGESLVVTPVTRTAGPLQQTITTVGSTVTVTLQPDSN